MLQIRFPWCTAAVMSVLFFSSIATKASSQTAAPAPVATGSLAGIVRDISGAPLPDVDVTLVCEDGASRTDSVGRFTLRGVALGNHTVLFRHLGHTSVEYRWTARAGAGMQITVGMTPLPHRLDRVVVEAPGARRRHGTSSIGGRVVDSANRPVAGADVRLLGAGLSTVSDSAGEFAFHNLAAGAYIVRARRLGLAGTIGITQIADDDPHALTLKLFGIPKNTSVRDNATASGYGTADRGFDEFDRRTRDGPLGPVLGPADLFRANHASLDFVLARYRDLTSVPRRHSTTATDGKGSSEDGDCLLMDGRRPLYRQLGTFTSLEVLLVEVFRTNAVVDEYIVSQMDAIPECRGSMDRHPPYFVLWTRTLR